ncbi:tripartite motif-containing protein 16-like [Polypterus senegalus]|nr:tripartite motif-containing protein 16-like [Polypterus senegalus]
MAEAQLCGLQDNFTCSVCLDTLTDPITIPCGHSFCLKCLTDCWDQSQVCSCPQCRHTFTTRPELNRNTLLNEVIKKLKKTTLSSPPPQNYSGPGDVECDFCTEKKFTAVKSCLTCMASFCQIHLQLHYEGDAWKGHKLTDPDRNLKEKLCVKHQKSLEMFCKTDDSCICMMCGMTEHNSHEKVELETEREEKQKQLWATLSDINRRLEEREKTLKETRRVMEEMMVSRIGRQHFISKRGEINENLKSSRASLVMMSRDMRREIYPLCLSRHKGSQDFLTNHTSKLQTFNCIIILKSFLPICTFSSRCVFPAVEDSLSFTVTADFSSEDMRKELSSLTKSVEKISQWVIMTRTSSAHEAPVFTLQPPEPQSRDDFLKYFCALTLDINTAHRDLRLSEGNKKVTCEGTKAEYPDHPDRFDIWSQVLCREALTGTRCYWEVECSGDFMVIGVAYKGLSRKGWECGLGYNDKSWSLQWSYFQYSVCHSDKQIVISAPYSARIGVYLDWPAGSLSFYSVSHTMTLLHRFNTSFTEPLYPGFGFYLGFNSSVTISHLTPWDH